MKPAAIAAAGALFVILWLPAATARERLMTARAHRHLVETIAAAPALPAPALVPRSRMLTAPDANRANAALAARLRAAAERTGLLVEALAPVRSAPGLATADAALSGRQAVVLAFIAAVEDGPVLVRFTRWRMVAVGGGSVRLDARAVASW